MSKCICIAKNHKGQQLHFHQMYCGCMHAYVWEKHFFLRDHLFICVYVSSCLQAPSGCYTIWLTQVPRERSSVYSASERSAEPGREQKRARHRRWRRHTENDRDKMSDIGKEGQTHKEKVNQTESVKTDKRDARWPDREEEDTVDSTEWEELLNGTLSYMGSSCHCTEKGWIYRILGWRLFQTCHRMIHLLIWCNIPEQYIQVNHIRHIKHVIYQITLPF